MLICYSSNEKLIQWPTNFEWEENKGTEDQFWVSEDVTMNQDTKYKVIRVGKENI